MATLTLTPILVMLNFTKAFNFDVDWSTHGVGAIMSQKEGIYKEVIVYANKRFSFVYKKFHPMEGECYALIRGILHFWQYLYIGTTSHYGLITLLQNAS
jgi:hypothetical protein